MPKPWVIAHRGASAYAPENTMRAFRRAVELGAQFIETDIHVTRDARLVAIHDATLERTTNGHGPVKDFTLAELLEFDAGSWFHPQFAGERIPTLEEILAFAREADVVFYLEIKADAAWVAEHTLVHALRTAGEAARTVLLSFQPTVLAGVQRLDRTMMTGLLAEEPRNDVVEQCLRVGARQLAPRGDLVTRELVQKAHSEDLRLISWTINEPEQMRALLAAGVDGLMTDYPDRLRDVVAAQP